MFDVGLLIRYLKNYVAETIRTRKAYKQIVKDLRERRDASINPHYRKAMNEAIREIKTVPFLRQDGGFWNCMGKRMTREESED